MISPRPRSPGRCQLCPGLPRG